MAAALFTSPAYLEPLEQHGCVRPQSGWTPLPLTLSDNAYAPCYLKTHSWGEFVFDFQIARAYAQRGLDYYPKLVCCVPFTPVPGPRLLAADDAGRFALADALREQARAHGASSAHVLYPSEAEAALLTTRGWLLREQPRYLWLNRGYADFDAFLAALSAKRRKNVRRERRHVASLGLQIEWRAAPALSAAEWKTVYALYASTYEIRGQAPYLNRACLQAWGERCGAAMQFCLARRDGRIEAMAFFFRDGDALYGRHWGARVDEPLLHFELCYYQGIDHAIRHHLRLFDAGVQGEHKLLRGFDPVTAHSLHWYAHEDFHAALAAHYAAERRAVAEQLRALAAHSAYREDQPA